MWYNVAMLYEPGLSGFTPSDIETYQQETDQHDCRSAEENDGRSSCLGEMSSAFRAIRRRRRSLHLYRHDVCLKDVEDIEQDTKSGYSTVPNELQRCVVSANFLTILPS